MASECYGLKGHKLKLFGFGIKQGFYCIEIPEAINQNQGNGANIRVLEGDADEKKIEEELKNLIDNKWDWQVKKLSREEFVVNFPNKQSLDIFSKMSELSTTIHNIKIRVLKNDLDPEATGKLHMVWMKIYGMPTFAKIESVVKEVAAPAAEPMVVDELSLIRSGPVRVKVKCRDPAQLRGFVEIFFNSVGYEVRFLVGGFKYTSKGDGPLGGGDEGHDKKDDKDMYDTEESDEEGYDVDDTKTEWELLQEKEKEKGKDGQTQKDSLEGMDFCVDRELPLACFDPFGGTLRVRNNTLLDMDEELYGNDDKQEVIPQSASMAFDHGGLTEVVMLESVNVS